MAAYTPEQLAQYNTATQGLLHDDESKLNGLPLTIVVAAAEELEYDNQATDRSDLVLKLYG